jgi:hypothetical protein
MFIVNENILHSNHPRNQIRRPIQKFPEFLKKYSYKFEILAPFQAIPPVTGCSDHSAPPTAANIVYNLQLKI